MGIRNSIYSYIGNSINGLFSNRVKLDTVNKTIEENIDFIISQNIYIIWQCGKNYFKDYKKYNSASVFVTDFIDDIDSASYSTRFNDIPTFDTLITSEGTFGFELSEFYIEYN